MLKVADILHTRAGVHRFGAGRAAPRGQSAPVYLLAVVLAVLLLGAGAKFSWAAPAEHAITCAAAVDSGAHKDALLIPRVNVSALADERDAISDATLLDTTDVIIGGASMYNPYNADDSDAGGIETASGEPYDPVGWTAAIQTSLRSVFGGIKYGHNYSPAFALVEGAGKSAIVKINDVGPLRPGRVIDFSQRTMSYFDPTLQRGLIHGVVVTPLVGSNWTPGPFGTAAPVIISSNIE